MGKKKKKKKTKPKNGASKVILDMVISCRSAKIDDTIYDRKKEKSIDEID